MTYLSSIVFQFNLSSASSVAALSGRPAAQRDAHRRVRLVVGPVLHRRPLARPGWEGGGKISIFWEICANVWRSCYRMYQNELLQEHNYAFDSIFQALQEVHASAPLQT